MILAIFHHIYRLKLRQELQVIFQVQCLNYDQVWDHQLIQVKILETNNQAFHQEYHQSSLLIILSLYHHIKQVGIDPSVVPISFPHQKPSSVTSSVTSLSTSTNTSLASSNKQSNLTSAVPSVNHSNDTISVYSYVPSVGSSASPTDITSTLLLRKHASVT